MSGLSGYAKYIFPHMKTFLPGLRTVGYLPAEALPTDIPLIARAGLPVPVMTDITWIPIIGNDNTASATSEGRGADSLESADLSFRTDSAIRFPPRAAFVVVAQSGQHYLIGSAEPPYVQVSFKIDFGSIGAAAGIAYTVSHKAIRTLIPCVCPFD